MVTNNKNTKLMYIQTYLYIQKYIYTHINKHMWFQMEWFQELISKFPVFLHIFYFYYYSQLHFQHMYLWKIFMIFINSPFTKRFHLHLGNFQPTLRPMSSSRGLVYSIGSDILSCSNQAPPLPLQFAPLRHIFGSGYQDDTPPIPETTFQSPEVANLQPEAQLPAVQPSQWAS